MAEWSKAHDWKSCVPPKGTEGSNPSLSASLFFNLLTTQVIFCLNMKLLNRLITDIKGYYDTEGNKKLSQSFNDDVCQCAEICILAQAYFQKYGFDTKYFDSELLRSKDEEFGEADSFISMRTDIETLVYAFLGICGAYPMDKTLYLCENTYKFIKCAYRTHF